MPVALRHTGRYPVGGALQAMCGLEQEARVTEYHLNINFTACAARLGRVRRFGRPKLLDLGSLWFFENVQVFCAHSGCAVVPCGRHEYFFEL
jgi:hypothetical protein